MALALPGVVAADGAIASELVWPGSVPEVELTEPKLDLSLDPGHLQVQDIRPVPPVAAHDGAGPGVGQASVEKPLTFGLDVRTRPRVGDEIRADVVDPPDLGGELKGAIDRSTFGVTGTYRF